MPASPTTALASPCDRAAPPLAQWWVVLAGWLWLGFQGLHLGWHLAGGLGVVALWWALRQLCSHWAALSMRLKNRASVLGLATGAGVLVVHSTEPGSASLGVLLATAVAWALWSAALVRQVPRSVAPSGAPAAAVLSATAMGLMMGSLWLSSEWCATRLWPAPAMLALHVGLMALLPVLLRVPASALQAHPLWREALPLTLLAAGGACLLTTSSPAGWMAGMGLQALAWGLCRAPLCHTPALRSAAFSGVLALGGPCLLVLVGLLSPTAGPQALHSAQAFVGALAVLSLACALWQASRPSLDRSPLELSPTATTRMDTP